MTSLESISLSRRGMLSAAAIGLTTSVMPRPVHAMANSEVDLGFISCGGRAQNLMKQFGDAGGSNIAAICDVDSKRVAQVGARHAKASPFTDMRQLLETNVDAVVIATCNHWHCLAAIWAMEAGKHVYVEKPLSHSQWEGEQTVAAADIHNRVAAIGTQQRSDPMQAAIKSFLHDQKGIGELTAVRVNRYGIRKPIGRRSEPLRIDDSVAYDRWLGPATDEPIYRDQLHYDWHWDWNTGNGEMGNWGVHVLDDVRNNVFRDEVALPRRILGGGGRVAYDDAGQTPNVHFVYFDTGTIPVVIGLSNLPAEPGSKKSAAHPGPSSGYVVYGTEGYLHGQRQSAQAFDMNGNSISNFKGNGDVKHQSNFIEAVKAEDASILNADIQVGHDSTGWCNLANIAFRSGQAITPEDLSRVSLLQWTELMDQTEQHLAAHGLSFQSKGMQLSSLLEIDSETGQFDNPAANAMLKREYRAEYQVPELAMARA